MNYNCSGVEIIHQAADGQQYLVRIAIIRKLCLTDIKSSFIVFHYGSKLLRWVGGKKEGTERKRERMLSRSVR